METELKLLQGLCRIMGARAASVGRTRSSDFDAVARQLAKIERALIADEHLLGYTVEGVAP